MDPNADIAAYDKLFGCYSIKIIKSLRTSAFKITKLTILMNMSLEKVQPNAQVLLDKSPQHTWKMLLVATTTLQVPVGLPIKKKKIHALLYLIELTIK